MPRPGIRLGVDFGTSNTVAVVRWPDGRARPLLFDGSPLLPSAVYCEPSGTLIVGRDAVHSARLEPARFEPNPKRRIDDGSVLLGDRELAVGELVAAVLRRVREEWRRTVGDTPTEVSLSCPATWGATRRLTVADAAAAAGLGRVRLVAEPVAAAAYFTQVLGRDVPIGSVVVVHDFGAGTFDASVVARTSGGFEVLAVDGRDDIGGVDIDDAMVRHIGSACAERDPAAWQRLMRPSTVEDRRARRLLFDDARVAKERLSRSQTADLTIPLLNSDAHLTRDELEVLARPLLEQTIRVTQGVIRWAQLAEGRIAGVFLVGGSSRIPLVATLLHRALGEAPVAIEQPELVVAEGSMLTGAAVVPVGAAPAPGPATGSMPRLDIAGRPVPVGAQRPSVEPVQPPIVPVSGVPVSGVPVSGVPVSGPPVSGLPVSGPPVSSPPVSSRPVSSPPARTGTVFRSGSAAVSPPVPVGPAVPLAPAPTRQLPRLREQDSQPATPGPGRGSNGSSPVAEPPWQGGRYRGRRPVARAFSTVFLIVLLVAAPVIAFVIAYYLTTGEWPPVGSLFGQ